MCVCVCVCVRVHVRAHVCVSVLEGVCILVHTHNLSPSPSWSQAEGEAIVSKLRTELQSIQESKSSLQQELATLQVNCIINPNPILQQCTQRVAVSFISPIGG